MKLTTEIPQKEGYYYAKGVFKDAPVFPVRCVQYGDGSFQLLVAGSHTPIRMRFEMSDGSTPPAILIGDRMDEHLSSVEATITISSSELEEAGNKAESERVSAIFPPVIESSAP
jgi:hypothetical protein